MISQEVLESRLFWLNQLPKVDEENQRHLERYKKFILSRPNRPLKKEKEFHKHHICPKCFGEFDVKENLIKLSYKEHFIAHLFLWKCGYPQMIIAFHLMSTVNVNGFDSIKIHSRLYEELKKEYSQIQSESLLSGKNPIYGKIHMKAKQRKK